jgi:hypothetical protein
VTQRVALLGLGIIGLTVNEDSLKRFKIIE